jgi:hypothetical protein
VSETCVKCGAPLEIYVLQHDWLGFAPGDSVWVRSESDGGERRGQGVCDGRVRPYTIEETHSPINEVDICSTLRFMAEELA